MVNTINLNKKNSFTEVTVNYIANLVELNLYDYVSRFIERLPKDSFKKCIIKLYTGNVLDSTTKEILFLNTYSVLPKKVFKDTLNAAFKNGMSVGVFVKLVESCLKTHSTEITEYVLTCNNGKMNTIFINLLRDSCKSTQAVNPILKKQILNLLSSECKSKQIMLNLSFNEEANTLIEEIAEISWLLDLYKLTISHSTNTAIQVKAMESENLILLGYVANSGQGCTYATVLYKKALLAKCKNLNPQLLSTLENKLEEGPITLKEFIILTKVKKEERPNGSTPHNLNNRDLSTGEINIIDIDCTSCLLYPLAFNKLKKVTSKHFRYPKRLSIESRLSAVISTEEHTLENRTDLLSILYEVLVTKMSRKRRNNLIFAIINNVNCSSKALNIIKRCRVKKFRIAAQSMLEAKKAARK